MGAQSFTCSVPMSVRLTCPNNFTSWAHRPSDLPESTKAAPRIVPAWPRAPRSQLSSLGAHGRFSNVCRACLSESCSSGRAPPWPLALLQGARLLSQARLPERGAYFLTSGAQPGRSPTPGRADCELFHSLQRQLAKYFQPGRAAFRCPSVCEG